MRFKFLLLRGCSRITRSLVQFSIVSFFITNIDRMKFHPYTVVRTYATTLLTRILLKIREQWEINDWKIYAYYGRVELRTTTLFAGKYNFKTRRSISSIFRILQIHVLNIPSHVSQTRSLYVAAMIIDYRDCCMREPSFGCQWIMWYGDYQLSEVKIIERY